MIKTMITQRLSRIATVAEFTLLEEVRGKVLNATFLFAAILLYLGIIMSRLAQGFEERFIRDMSFFLIELFGIAILLQSAYRVVHQDVRKGASIEIIFVRPIARWEYLLGRFIGVAFVLGVGISVMALFSGIWGLMRGYDLHWIYAITLVSVYFKLLTGLSLSFFFALITTSQASFLAASILAYISGHVVSELRMLLSMPQNQDLTSSLVIKPITYLAPNFSLVDTKNTLSVITADPNAFDFGDFSLGVLYIIIYSAFLIVFSMLLFERKEILPT
ncbi:hypothetical protein ACFL6Y_06015 [Elusimicrobiota bacterium]